MCCDGRVTTAQLWRTARSTPRRQVVSEAAATFAVGLALVAMGLVGTNGTRAVDVPSPWLFALPLTAICLLLLAKRTRPGLAAGAGTLVLAVDLALGGSIGVVIAYFDLLYCVAVWGTDTLARRAEVLAACAVSAAGAIYFISTGDLRASALLCIVVFTLLAAPLWWGRSVRTQTELARVAAARARDLHRLAELREAEVLQAERTRMAGELHDALAGNLAAIGIHAEASLARPAQTQDPTTRRSLAAIRQASVAASDELRTMVRLLRSDEAERTSPARLAEITGALEQARHHGLRVELEAPDTWPSLTASVDHAAHRIVQESLTNAAKHAPASTVLVRIRALEDRLDLLVDNTLAAAAGATPGDGIGLRSMRERAESLGGTLVAGRVDDHWQVSATLPTTPDEGSPP